MVRDAEQLDVDPKDWPEERKGTRRPVPEDQFGGRLSDAFLLDLEVTEARDLAPHVRLVTFGSSDLVGFKHVAGQDVMIEFPAGDGRSVRRRYSIRRTDPDLGRLDIEAELHDHAGVGTRWIAGAGAGDRLHAIGPRGKIGLRSGCDEHVFVADDSAMPAAFAMLEALGPEASATGFFVTRHGPHSRPGPQPPASVRQVWLEEADLADALVQWWSGARVEGKALRAMSTGSATSSTAPGPRWSTPDVRRR